MRKPWFIFGAIMWLLVLVYGYRLWQNSDTSSGSGADFSSEVPSTELSEQGEPNEIWSDGLPDFSLTSHTGETITKQDLIGRPWVAAFIFTSCLGTCPALSSKMELLQDELRDTDVRLISFTVDPENDTPEVLAKYAKSFNAEPDRWLFLTGSEKEIFSLIEKGFKVPVARVDGAPQGFQVAHSNDFILVDEKGFVQGKADAKTDSELAAFRRKLVKRYGPQNQPDQQQSSDTEEDTSEPATAEPKS